MVALCSATLAPCSPFLLQQQEQWCWDARAWLGWMVKAGSSPQQRGSHCPCPDSPWAASAWQSPAASPGLGSACVLGTPERCLCHLSSPPPWTRCPADHSGLELGSGDKRCLWVPAVRKGQWSLCQARRCPRVPCDRARLCPAPPGLWAEGGSAPTCCTTGRKAEGSRSAVQQHGGLGGEILG